MDEAAEGLQSYLSHLETPQFPTPSLAIHVVIIPFQGPGPICVPFLTRGSSERTLKAEAD